MSGAPNEAEPIRFFGRFGAWPTIVGLLSVVVVGLAMPVPFIGRIAVAAGDLVHAPLFGGLALFAMYLWQRLRPVSGRQLLVRGVVVGLGLALFGASMEIMQYAVGRTATIHDAVANSLGITAALLWYASGRYRLTGKSLVSRFLVAAALITLLVAWLRPIAMLNDVWAVHRDFPLLASFESRAEMDRWYFRNCQGARVIEDATHGSYALEIEYEATPSPGATMIEIRKDWSQLETLELDIVADAAATQSTAFMLKVIDASFDDTQDYEDMFVRTWELVPGKRQHLSVTRAEILNGPPQRKTDLTNIRYVDLVVLDSVQPTKLRIDHMHLKLRSE